MSDATAVEETAQPEDELVRQLCSDLAATTDPGSWYRRSSAARTRLLYTCLEERRPPTQEEIASTFTYGEAVLAREAA
jgi:hypothetical protein